MKLKDILAISGKSGLYKFISQGRNGIIVESFDDHSRSLAHASEKVSTLEDIAIFTETEELPLAKVFKKIFEKENGKPTISYKSSPEELKVFFEGILPDYDRNKVYVSDIKKVVNWYNILIDQNLIDTVEEENQKDEDNNEIRTDEPKKTNETRVKSSKGTTKIKAETKAKTVGVKKVKKKT
jgi:Domain of unknown function (DUF5606)